MADYLITNARLWDGGSDALVPADVRVRANRIEAISRNPGALAPEGCETIDAAGMALMPGLVEGHCHPSFTGISFPAELGPVPPEEHPPQREELHLLDVVVARQELGEVGCVTLGLGPDRVGPILLGRVAHIAEAGQPREGQREDGEDAELGEQDREAEEGADGQ